MKSLNQYEIIYCELNNVGNIISKCLTICGHFSIEEISKLNYLANKTITLAKEYNQLSWLQFDCNNIIAELNQTKKELLQLVEMLNNTKQNTPNENDIELM